jgi:hypothetical protein
MNEVAVDKVRVVPCLRPPAAACFLQRRPRIDPTAVHMGFVAERVVLWQVSVGVLPFSLSVSSHRGSICTNASSRGWTIGPLAAQFYRHVVCPLSNNKGKSFSCTTFQLTCSVFLNGRLWHTLTYLFFVSAFFLALLEQYISVSPTTKSRPSSCYNTVSGYISLFIQ